jgi:hypothetical protein
VKPGWIDADTQTVAMKYYDVMHVNGDTYEVEAEFYQREGDDWVFYANGSEVYRVAFLDVLGVTKTPTWVREEPNIPEVWL